jgi:hypothetical protein
MVIWGVGCLFYHMKQQMYWSSEENAAHPQIFEQENNILYPKILLENMRYFESMKIFVFVTYSNAFFI